MAITIAQKKVYPILPAGIVNAALGAIIAWPNFPQKDYKNAGKFNYKTRLIFAYVTDQLQENGEPFDILQLTWDSDISHPKSGLAPILTKLAANTGVRVEPGMDIEQFIGAQVVIMAEHSEENGKTYVNVGSFQRNPKGTVQIPAGYAEKLEQRLQGMKEALLKKAGISTPSQNTVPQSTLAATVADADLAF